MNNLVWLIIIVLLVAWLAGAFVVKVGSGLIHILLVIALILIVWRLVTGKRVL